MLCRWVHGMRSSHSTGAAAALRHSAVCCVVVSAKCRDVPLRRIIAMVPRMQRAVLPNFCVRDYRTYEKEKEKGVMERTKSAVSEVSSEDLSGMTREFVPIDGLSEGTTRFRTVARRRSVVTGIVPGGAAAALARSKPRWRCCHRVTHRLGRWTTSAGFLIGALDFALSSVLCIGIWTVAVWTYGQFSLCLLVPCTAAHLIRRLLPFTDMNWVPRT